MAPAAPFLGSLKIKVSFLLTLVGRVSAWDGVLANLTSPRSFRTREVSHVFCRFIVFFLTYYNLLLFWDRVLLCSLDWLWTCLGLPSAGIIVVHHHVWLHKWIYMEKVRGKLCCTLVGRLLEMYMVHMFPSQQMLPLYKGSETLHKVFPSGKKFVPLLYF
jgi:hypothetical protein